MTQQYKLKFRHWKTGDIIEKIVTKPDFEAQGDRAVYYNITDDRIEDVIKKTIVEELAIGPEDDDYIPHFTPPLMFD